MPRGDGEKVSFQILAVTMHQKDLGIAERMNIRCDAVIANQADREEIVNKKNEFGELKMITTPTRGVGLNRNIGLMAATADVLLFGDDDMVYNDDVEQSVLSAFSELPEADVIVFGMDILKNGVITEKRRNVIRKLHIWNAMRFGTCRIAVRRKAIVNNNITFSQCFGGGCEFSSGEDSLFLKNCFDRGLKVYSHSYALGTCCKDTSTWFKGYNEKFFYDKGILTRKLFPRCSYIVALYFSVRYAQKTDLSFFKRIGLLCAGIRGSKKMVTYENRK